MNLPQYIETVAKRYQSGISSEHTYRTDLESLIRALVPGVDITNEPLKVTDCGNPDYVITKGKIPIGFIEAKDVGKDLKSKTYKPQFDRYRKALDNLMITDYLWFRFFQHGKLVYEIRIGEIIDHSVHPIADNFSEFQDLIQNFCTFIGQTITSSKKLAQMMAAKARLLQSTLEAAITSDEKNQDNTSIQEQYKSFKEILIHDLGPKEFADIYAQTLAYGMFAARLHDTSLDDFSRQEAAELIPKTNPFLRRLFQYVAGPEIDARIKTTVDNLADVFRATNVEALLTNFGKSTQSHDPIIHFYETFLAEYDPKLRKARGVWYTPEPVVNFIVRAVDDLLKSEFGLKEGLADTSKTTINVALQGTAITKGKNKGKAIIESKEVHKVQILDPATGTGTFLAEVVKFIYSNKFKAMQGAWSAYVEEHLIPRLNGFELLMASYAMAHLKLDMLLSETGYKATKEQRFNIYLTNSLEEHHPDTGTLFAHWLSAEANEANHIKRDTPVMVVMGNPPYSGESANKGKWIMDLMTDYKKEPGGKEKLKERNPKWINDDYVKFLRYGQHFIERNGEGILAFINPHGFLDNPTFRGMRWHLLKTYDKIYTIDLHGNSKKKESCPDGSPDVNVFDIQQGVSINFFIKTGKKKPGELGQVLHYDLWGSRQNKYDFLIDKEIKNINFARLQNKAPQYFMVPKDYKVQEIYAKGFGLKDLFNTSVMGFQTHRDHFAIADTKSELQGRINSLLDDSLETSTLSIKYALKDVGSWKLKEKRKEIQSEDIFSNIAECAYRPFDDKFVFMHNAINDRPRPELKQHVVEKNNICLLVSKQQSILGFQHCFTTKHTANDCVISSKSREGNQVFPLYLYPETSGQQTFEAEPERKPNLDTKIVQQIAKELAVTFAPIDLLDYIYAVLHSPGYREKYKEFLKIDFPRVPFPKNKDTFWQLVKLGGEIRQIHLLESDKVEAYITTYPKDGDNVITRKLNKNDWDLYDNEKQLGRIWINDTQYFDQIPLIAWTFYIGGYQPAQKWLKDRRGRKLNFEDILHYQKIIVALTETDRLMKEIDKIDLE